MEEEMTFDGHMEIIRRQFAILNSTWNAKEKDSARLLARIAAEQLAEYIRRY